MVVRARLAPPNVDRDTLVPVFDTTRGDHGHGGSGGADEAFAHRLDDGVDENRVPLAVVFLCLFDVVVDP